MSLPIQQDKFFAMLDDEIVNHLSVEHQQQVIDFSRILYQRYPLSEITDRTIQDVFGNAFSSWRFIQNLDRSRPKIRIFNPEYEKHGWVSNATVVAVLSRDMSFIRDSLRAEFHRRGIAIHQIYAALFSAKRDEHNHLISFEQRVSDDRSNDDEVLLYMEISRHSDSRVLEELETTLASIMEEVRIVNDDFDAMRQRIEETINAISETPDNCCSDPLKENIAFLRWTLDNNFTFLGYECLTVKGSGKTLNISRKPGSELGVMRLRSSRGAENLRSELIGSLKNTDIAKQQLTFAKSVYRSRVHRDTYPQYFTIKCFDKKGKLTHQVRFLGLFTSPVYTQSTLALPLVRSKVREVLRLSGFKAHSHDGKEITRILEVHPRDELFQSSIDQLFQVATTINQIQERRKIKLLVRRGVYNRFVSCLVFVPREIYRTELRINIQHILSTAFNAVESEFTTYFSESILTRTHFYFKLADDAPLDINSKLLEVDIVEACYGWSERLHDILIDEFGEERGTQLSNQYCNAFPAGYREDFAPRAALGDLQRITQLDEGHAIATSLHRVIGESSNRLHFRICRADSPLPLSDVIPVLENMGLRVIGENPYDIRRSDGRVFWCHDFSLEFEGGEDIDVQDVADQFKQAFAHIWRSDADNDSFNKLILFANLHWRDISMLRAYARYMKQIRFNISEAFIAEALLRYPNIVTSLVRLFYIRFDPDYSSEGRALAVSEAETEVLDALESVSNLNDDTIFRLYLSLLMATLRCNFFIGHSNGNHPPTLAFKLQPRNISQVPKPRPMFEIFVYSPRVEGVHLRGGKVARGGLRWSDRHEDFRTEILGLVKAQQVKNSVIVPVGAKGGFICKKSPIDGDRDAILTEGIRCYQLFIQSLLDVTDNLDGVNILPPKDVVRWDDDDPYLVVAADKGTATFSDIANEISRNNNFWLGDAFASGGSQGFDHKKMGITARGAWVSVQRHFQQLGVDVQQEDFTVVGIGDMAGDVFGNGMLLSEHIRLCAAFNHLHIFIDPNPDSATSFVERKRMFALPRSSWVDYNLDLISSGGGVFSRNVKSIDISPEMKRRFAIEEDKLNPNELISALLRSPVDLLWNGGIGTYVKSVSENHADVGDKANDGLRVNGGDLRCRVVGEGGNLGCTQRGRIEYSLQGGLCNTDFIDNSAGVDCSDHEVNIKILLNDICAAGDMTEKQRNVLLEQLIDPVADLVLRNNFRQAQSLAIAQSDAPSRIQEHREIINLLETQGLLDRRLENLPSDDDIAERRIHGQGLSRPEFSILMSYVKGILKHVLASENIAGDPYINRCAVNAFPHYLRDNFPENIARHKLHNEIVATQMANDVVNYMGLTFVHRLHESTGVTFSEIVKSYVFVRDVFDLKYFWGLVENSNGDMKASLQMELLQNIIRLGRRATRWGLRNRRQGLDVTLEVDHFKPNIKKIMDNMLGLLKGHGLERWRKRFDALLASGSDEQLAHFIASTNIIYSSLGITDAAQQSGDDLLTVAEVFFDIGEELELDWFAAQLTQLKVDSHWQALARETFMDDLDWQHRALTVNVLQCMRNMQCDLDGCRTSWLAQNSIHIERWKKVLNQLKNNENVDFAMYSVAIRELFDLAQASVYR